jgi:hypothetical protein
MEGLWKGQLTSMTDLLCMEMHVISRVVKRKPEMFGCGAGHKETT